MIIVPQFSPIAFKIFGFGIHWYALAYLISFILCFWLMKKLSYRNNCSKDDKFWDDLMFWGIVGIICGGRIGYCLIYNFHYYMNNPMEIFALWHGGMSFHGGALGFLIATIIFSKIRQVNWLKVLDLAVVVAPIGLFLGRIANFINMELMGRMTDMPWGIVFENSDITYPRHPSPLYEAFLEGLVLLIIMNILFFKTNLKDKAGKLTGIFVILYALFRIFVENFRMPDEQLGFLAMGLTMGQILSILMTIIGIFIFYNTKLKKVLGIIYKK